jgi:LPS-assembly lipoprotein
MFHPARRQFLNHVSGVCVGVCSAPSVLLASGCGFTMRGTLALSFRSVALVGFTPRSSLERSVRTQLNQWVTIEDNPARAEVVVQALRDTRERAVVATSAAGQVRELQLRVKLAWRAATPRGVSLVEPNELLLTRDMSYNESAALAKEQEADALYGAMDEDIAQQMMRRLASVQTHLQKVGGQPGTAPR